MVIQCLISCQVLKLYVVGIFRPQNDLVGASGVFFVFRMKKMHGGCVEFMQIENLQDKLSEGNRYIFVYLFIYS